MIRIPKSIKVSGWFNDYPNMLYQDILNEYEAMAVYHNEGESNIEPYEGLILGDDIIDNILEYIPDKGFINTDGFWKAYRYFMDLN